MITNQVYEPSVNNISGHELFVDLIAPDMHDFNVTLVWVGSSPTIPMLIATIKLCLFYCSMALLFNFLIFDNHFLHSIYVIRASWLLSKGC